MASREKIQVQKREITGKKTKRLRKQGILPANIYGSQTESVAIQLGYHDFRVLLKSAGETDLIDLVIDEETKPRPVLIHDVQVDPVNSQLIHIDFLEVNLSEKIEVSVPLKYVGESSAVKENRGLLLTLMDELPIKVLPADIPSHFDIDISSLQEVNDHLTVASIQVPAGVEVLVDDPEDLIVKVEAVRTAEEEEAAEAESAAHKAESKEGEAVEGEEGAEEAEKEEKKDKDEE
jgi:large subunit ribosomal protein L25